MTKIDQFFSYCEQLRNMERNTGERREYKLDRMRRMLAFAENPHLSQKVIHVAGSKGKGSTVMSIAKILSGHRKVGIFLSPHIAHYRERIQLLPDTSSDPFILAVAGRVQEIAESVTNPTTFEVLTLTAFLVFQEAGCDWVVLETGLGGRLDCTNLVEPRISIITSIEKEHKDYLGHRLEEIAYEKGGIIKEGVPVILGKIQGVARRVLMDIAQQRNSPVFAIDDWVISRIDAITIHSTQIFLQLRAPLPGRKTALFQAGLHLHMGLIGSPHMYTAAMALLALLLSREKISIDAFAQGLKETYLPGRMELITASPALLFDVAHTPDSIFYSFEAFFHLFPQGGKIIFGCIEGKDVPAMAQKMRGYIKEIVVTTAGNIRPSKPQAVARILSEAGMNTTLIEDPIQALQDTRHSHPTLPILVTGSFYLIASLWEFSHKKGLGIMKSQGCTPI